MSRKLLSRGINGCDSKYPVRFQRINKCIDIRIPNYCLVHYIINRFFMECQKITMLMLPQQTFDTCIFQYPSCVTTQYLFDKWFSEYANILVHIHLSIIIMIIIIIIIITIIKTKHSKSNGFVICRDGENAGNSPLSAVYSPANSYNFPHQLTLKLSLDSRF